MTKRSATSVTQEYAEVDAAAKVTEQYLTKRSRDLDRALEKVERDIAAREEENVKLEEEVRQLEAIVVRQREQVAAQEQQLEELEGPQR